MHIVSDGGMDLPQDEVAALGIHIVPHTITLGGETYRSNVDLMPDDLYRLLDETGDLPVTAAPSAGDFARLYRRLAQSDPDILSIHMSPGLSAPANAAMAAKQMVPEANVTVVSTKTLSAVLGWIVAAAARAARAGWPVERIVAMVRQIDRVSDSVYSLDDLKYLIHGGRISHMKGLVASALHLRPVITVEKVRGTYAQLGVARTTQRAIAAIVKHITRQHPPGTAMQMQVGHAANPAAAAALRARLDALYACTWLPEVRLTAMLGAHTGPTMYGIAYAPLASLPERP